MKYCLLVTVLALTQFTQLQAEEYWLFAGQSNMSPKGQSRAAFTVMPQDTKRKMLQAQTMVSQFLLAVR